jgi:hypothetical protein
MKKKRITLTDQQIYDLLDCLPGIRNRLAGATCVIRTILVNSGVEGLPEWFDMDRKTVNRILKELFPDGSPNWVALQKREREAKRKRR